MAIEKSLSTTLVFTSPDGRARVEIGTQIDFSYALESGGQSVVSLPLSALAALDELVTALMADEDVQALIPEPPVEPPVEPTPEPEPHVEPEEPELEPEP